MKRALTDRIIEAFPKPIRRAKWGDAKMKNLILVVEPSGKIYWKWQGRVGGKVREAHLGQFPAMGAADARKAAWQLTDARDLAQMKGQPFQLPTTGRYSRPAAAAEPDAAAEGPKDCNWLWSTYMKYDGGGKAGSAEKQRCWDKDIAPFIGSKFYASITYDDLAEIIVAKAESAPGAANHLVSYIKRLFRWAITRGRPFTRLAVDPARHLVQMSTTKTIDRVLSDDEIVWFFKAAAAMNDTFSEALIFTLYNGTRRDETFQMPWSEFQDRGGIWIIPGRRTKNGDELRLPLAPASLALLEARRSHSGNGNYVFPSNRGDLPISGFSKAMKAFRSKMREVATEEAGIPVEIPNWTIHDLRRTLSTGMHGLTTDNGDSLIPSDIVERVINHRLGKMRRTYDRNEYLAPKRRALLLWAEHLDAQRQRSMQPAICKAA